MGDGLAHTAEHARTTSPDPPTIEFRSIHAAALLDLLAEAAGDEATFNRILVTNPTRLYGF
jgi:hypothetical protein